MTKGTVAPITIECPLTLCFKGDRTYLHGTDVYESVVSALQARWPNANGGLSFAFHRIARNQCHAILTDSGDRVRRPENIAAQMTIRAGEHTLTAWVVEGTESIDCGVPYDEDAITARCEIRSEEIAISAPTDNTPIEIAVAMTKRLHYALDPNVSGHWMFTRLDLERPFKPTDRTGMRVVRRQSLGVRLSRSEVFSGEVRLGDIFFSVVAV